MRFRRSVGVDYRLTTGVNVICHDMSGQDVRMGSTPRITVKEIVRDREWL